jgi:hypothetical protein
VPLASSHARDDVRAQRVDAGENRHGRATVAQAKLAVVVAPAAEQRAGCWHRRNISTTERKSTETARTVEDKAVLGAAGHVLRAVEGRLRGQQHV